MQKWRGRFLAGAGCLGDVAAIAGQLEAAVMSHDVVGESSAHPILTYWLLLGVFQGSYIGHKASTCEYLKKHLHCGEIESPAELQGTEPGKRKTSRIGAPKQQLSIHRGRRKSQHGSRGHLATSDSDQDGWAGRVVLETVHKVLILG